MKTLYMKIDKEDISKYVLFSGDPFRVETVAKMMTDVKHIGFHREFNTYTGYYKGVRITVTSTGIGSPSAAIAMEEMFEKGMEVGVRMGTVMGLKDDLLGKFIIPKASIRREGTTKTYVESSYPAVADIELLSAMNKAVVENNHEYVNGINCTLDGFYSEMKESKLSKMMHRNIDNTFNDLKNMNVSGIDMESSVILTLGNLMGIKTCVVSMTTVLENLKEVLVGDARTQSEIDLCKVALDGIVKYDKGEY